MQISSILCNEKTEIERRIISSAYRKQPRKIFFILHPYPESLILVIRLFIYTAKSAGDTMLPCLIAALGV